MERRPKADLSGGQRKHLRGLAHHLQPLVRIGHQGLSTAVADAVFEALGTHELIKVKLLESAPVERKEAGEWLAEQCGAHLVGAVGKIVILYRRHPDTPQIPLKP
ncbi:MAG: YhbY family RNA-binding protein [Myxococcota bacterium]